MKKIIYILFVSLGLVITSCSEDILDKTPKDQISDPEFWKTDGDLELYINRLYSNFPGWYGVGSGGGPMPDWGTDVYVGAVMGQTRLDGVITVPASGGGWSWTNVRSANYFLENADRVTSGVNKDQYIGEGYFFRAWFYFELLKQFGDLTIITKTLTAADKEELYAARRSRTDVVDFIVSDLDLAIAKMKKKTQVPAGRLNKDIALLFKSRVCLYEGTWEKYHAGTPFAGKTDGSAFLNLAVTAAKAVIDGGTYSLTTGPIKSVYYELFNQTNYTNNPEVMFWKQYNWSTFGDDFGNQMWNWPHGSGITREMMRMYLSSDGLPISVSPLYKGDGDLRDVVVNRDQRAVQSVMNPGDPVLISLSNDTTKFVTPLLTGQRSTTGYEGQKFRRPQIDPTRGDYSQDMGYILFRYAEALLNYAEAKAELGQLTQADVDLSINKLRQRVGMPNLVLTSITTDPAWPDYGYTLTPALQEIRRERAVELMNEGFRLNDLMRWRAHKLWVGKRPKGTKYTAELKAKNPALQEDSEGYLDPFAGMLNGAGGNGYGFDPAKHYLLPLPINELTISPNLTQNPNYGN